MARRQFVLRISIVLLAALAMVASVSAQSSFDSRPSVLSAPPLLDAFSLTPEELKQAWQGEPVVKDLERVLDNELAAAVVSRVALPISEITATFEAKANSRSTETGNRGAFAIPPLPSDMNDLRFADNDVAWFLEQIGRGPGSQLNLSKREWARVERAEKVAAFESAYRHILANRASNYVARGLVGIEPYYRRGAPSSPADELGTALEATAPLLEAGLPDIAKALTNPRVSLLQVEDRYWWSKSRIDGQPGVVLEHESVYQASDYYVSVYRQFFASHSYNSALTVSIAVRWEGQTLVVQIGRTFTDQVAGIFSGMKRRVGQKMLRDSLQSGFTKAVGFAGR